MDETEADETESNVIELTEAELYEIKLKEIAASEIKEGLSAFSYFSKLTEEDVEEACAVGKIIHYKPNETVLGEDVGLSNHTYFILQGQCRVIHLLQTNKKRDSKSSNDSMATLESGEQLTSKKRFISVCLIDAGGCFNLGEQLANKTIVAINKVKCLLLPTHWIWTKNTSSNIWGRLQRYLERKIPEEEKILQEFKLEKRWEKHKVDLINHVLKNKKSRTTLTTKDIPYSIRIHERPFGN